ncbi:UDP-N-acetylglucosamine 1-carboxyvinyltransferase [Calycomorphotria hydatis]|uniref:UDP-N-acetylglucosamine 1-carboxyvinyltransferase n=1 Tax=Calycomorphotria hydatis TaxID=2528027 RepID=A0A517T803_9PLAN|nr:UDP-N-acetylglucosamine 1-carboxyvinyltransferase [Calycomorphotria hydatis]QDT64508.1 UDP-N-acetylglucosamine 1-carboxyvinyltransferase MurA [Calycomorphotria hydatis]
MDKFLIHGGRRLQGETVVSGSKNATLPLMAASLLADGPMRLFGVPDVTDVWSQIEALRHLGVSVNGPFNGTLTLDSGSLTSSEATCRSLERMRAGICLLGPLLARTGRAVLPLPGGCEIGERPIDLHLFGMQQLGAKIQVGDGVIIAEAKRLRGCEINLIGPRGSTATGTANIMMAATLAEGTTVIHGAAREPEVVDLANCLRLMGANIEGAGSNTIRIEGVRQLRGVDYKVIPDRIEAGTLLIAAAITQGEISLRECAVPHLVEIIMALKTIGTRIKVVDSTHLVMQGSGIVRPTSLSAFPYPGVPTDLQAQLTALLTQADGISKVTDHVFPQRFAHANELRKLGAELSLRDSTLTIRGRTKLKASPVTASDLRASAALILAALAAEGQTEVQEIAHLDRGYDSLDEKLNALGASISRESGTEETPIPRRNVA